MRRPRNARQMTMFDQSSNSAVQDDGVGRGGPVGPGSLSAGAGGLRLGFHLADLGYTPIFAVEHEPPAAATFERNFGCDVFAGDIEYGPDYPEADVVIGGPPCQGFSPLGRDRDDASRARLN